MSNPLCPKCRRALIDFFGPPGSAIEICYDCSIAAAVDYINNNRKIMEKIKSKRVLHSKIKEIMERSGDDLKSFPVSFAFSEGMGEPIFEFTITRTAEDHFIDEKGQKWVRAAE